MQPLRKKRAQRLQLQVFDFHIARSELLALREDLLMLRQDQGLQCLGIELIEIRKGGGIHCREPSTSLLQLD
jgi:hypothetical protein